MLPKFFTSFIKGAVQILFLLQAGMLLALVSFMRFLRLAGRGAASFVNPLKNTHPGVFQSEMELIKMKGFSIRTYEFQTEDHAKVVFWRLSSEKNLPVQTQSIIEQEEPIFTKLKVELNLNPGVPVLLQHGLLDCSLSWFLHRKLETTLPYILAKQGFDVWVGNNRGTKYSMGSKPSDSYWEYTIDHLIQYDIPCMFDSILKETGKEQLAYIGHSQGTVQFLSALDVHPQLHKKVKCFIGLGPVISLKHIDNHLILKVVSQLKLAEIAKFLGFNCFLVLPKWFNKMVGILSYNVSIYPQIIMAAILGLCGSNKDKPRIDINRLGMMVTHEPGGASINNVNHWVQVYRRGHLARYDYGKKQNMQVYGSAQSPLYTFNSLKNLPFKCYLFRGSQDRLIHDHDLKVLTDALHPDQTQVYTLQDYAHLDYLWCDDAAQDFYMEIQRIIRVENEGNLNAGNSKVSQSSDVTESGWDVCSQL